MVNESLDFGIVTLITLAFYTRDTRGNNVAIQRSLTGVVLAGSMPQHARSFTYTDPDIQVNEILNLVSDPWIIGEIPQFTSITSLF